MSARNSPATAPLTLDVVRLEGDLATSADFYAAAFGPVLTERDGAVEMDLHGAGRFELAPTASADGTGGDDDPTPFPGYVVTYALAQPSEVRAVMDAAVHAGAHVLKPAKKALFGSFSGAFRAPDGSVWKIAADSSRDRGAGGGDPRPTEISIILGVQAPTASRTFYQALGMETDRDYGNKYIDFRPVDSAVRLCLMQRAVLAKDVGIDDPGRGAEGLALDHRVEDGPGRDQLVHAAESAGGGSVAPPERTDAPDAGHFTDPDGFRWRLSA